MLDKPGNVAGYGELICFALSASILYQRIARDVIFQMSVYYMTIFYESVQTWLFLCFGCELVSKDSLSLDTLLLLILIGVIFAVFLIILRHLYFQNKMAGTENPTKTFKTAAHYEKYFFRIY